MELQLQEFIWQLAILAIVGTFTFTFFLVRYLVNLFKEGFVSLRNDVTEIKDSIISLNETIIKVIAMSDNALKERVEIKEETFRNRDRIHRLKNEIHTHLSKLEIKIVKIGKNEKE